MGWEDEICFPRCKKRPFQDLKGQDIGWYAHKTLQHTIPFNASRGLHIKPRGLSPCNGSIQPAEGVRPRPFKPKTAPLSLWQLVGRPVGGFVEIKDIGFEHIPQTKFDGGVASLLPNADSVLQRGLPRMQIL